jgi:hypothetical protein
VMKQPQDFQLRNRFSVQNVQDKKVIFAMEDMSSAGFYSVLNSELSDVYCIQYTILRSRK